MRWLWDFLVHTPRDMAGIAPIYLSAEIGDVSEDTIVVTFDREITSSTGDYQAGVAITEDDVGMTVGSYQKYEAVNVKYILTETTGLANVIEWAYAQVAGTIRAVVGGGPLENVSAKVVTNNIGTHLWFNSAEESAHVLHFF